MREALNQLDALDPGLLLLVVTSPTVCSMLVNTPSLDKAKYRTDTAISRTTQPMSEMRKLNFITDQGSIRSRRSCARRVCGPVAVPGVIRACGRTPGLGGPLGPA